MNYHFQHLWIPPMRLEETLGLLSLKDYMFYTLETIEGILEAVSPCVLLKCAALEHFALIGCILFSFCNTVGSPFSAAVDG